jgi:hypothetical protein
MAKHKYASVTFGELKQSRHLMSEPFVLSLAFVRQRNFDLITNDLWEFIEF